MTSPTHSPLLKKAEEKAGAVKNEDDKGQEDSPQTKRLCTIYEKKMKCLPEGDLGLVKAPSIIMSKTLPCSPVAPRS